MKAHQLGSSIKQPLYALCTFVQASPSTNSGLYKQQQLYVLDKYLKIISIDQ